MYAQCIQSHYAVHMVIPYQKDTLVFDFQSTGMPLLKFCGIRAKPKRKLMMQFARNRCGLNTRKSHKTTKGHLTQVSICNLLQKKYWISDCLEAYWNFIIMGFTISISPKIIPFKIPGMINSRRAFPFIREARRGRIVRGCHLVSKFL